MHCFSFDVNGLHYSIECYTSHTRSCHTDHAEIVVTDPQLNYEEVITVSGVCRWYNRTWQHYRYQTAILDGLHKWLDQLEYAYKVQFMQDYNCKRITGNRLKTLYKEVKAGYLINTTICDCKSAIAFANSGKQLVTWYAK